MRWWSTHAVGVCVPVRTCDCWRAEGSLWVREYRDRKIHQVDPATGAILRTIESNSFVTGVTWVDGELWHGTGGGR